MMTTCPECGYTQPGDPETHIWKCLSCKAYFHSPTFLKAEFPFDPHPDGTEVDGFVKTPTGWVEKSLVNEKPLYECPGPQFEHFIHNILDATVKGGGSGYLGLKAWVFDKRVMDNMLSRGLGFVISCDLLMTSDEGKYKHYQLRTQPLQWAQ